MFVLQLRLLVAKVLFLRLDDHVKLGFLSLYLLDELLEIRNLLKVLDLLRGNLLVQQVLLFLVSDLVFKLALAHGRF